MSAETGVIDICLEYDIMNANLVFLWELNYLTDGVKLIKRMSFSLIIVLLSVIHVMLNRYRGYAYDVGIRLDDIMPFYNVFVIPYLFWFLYMFTGIVFLAIRDSKLYYKTVAGIAVGMSACFVVFYFFPTTVPRPEVLGHGILNDLVRIVYSNDNPFNCFPSIHVLNTLILTFFLCRYENGGVGLKIYAILSYVLITLSTVFIRQHYILDAVAASALALIIFMVSNIRMARKQPWTARPRLLEPQKTTFDL